MKLANDSCLNRKLKEDGYLYLNTALESIGIEVVSERQLLGWIGSPEDWSANEDILSE